jgi:hypothetical protein
MARESIKIIHAALDEIEGKEIILRGVVDPDSLHLLQTAEYQREVLPLAHIRELVKAFDEGSIPDITLGMRGGSYTEKNQAFYLQDDVFIIDGLQRTTAAIERLQAGKSARLGATIYFNTTEAWEREQFHNLNALRVKLSPNILLRNTRAKIEIVETLFSLTTSDKNCVMRDRVCWSQRMVRSHLISALTFLKTIAWLHSHVAAGGKSNSLEEIVTGLQNMAEKISGSVLVHNMKAFFNLIDECWGIRSVAFKEGASYMRLTFLLTLASLFSRHQDFWRDKKLFVEKELQRKIKGFPLNDPNVKNLTAASGKARHILYQMLVEHVNSGKRTKRLTLRPEFRLTDAVESSDLVLPEEVAIVGVEDGS